MAANPLFAAVIVLTLALGIGANTAIFSVINAVVLRTLPVRDPQNVFLLRTEPGQPNGAGNTGNGDSSFSEYVFEQLRQNRHAFSDVMAYVPMGFNKIAVRSGNKFEEVAGEMVSGNYFSGLGVPAVCGHLLSPRDERAHNQVAVLSYGYWNRSFAHDCGVVGQALLIKGVPFTIIGVAGPRFIGLNGDPVDLWVPLQTRPDFNAWGSQGDNYYTAPNWWCILVAARTAPGLTAKQVEAAAAPTFLRAAYEHLGGKPKAGEKPPVLKLEEARGLSGYRDYYQKPLVILLAMVGVILIIACGNVSMLLAARNTARAREFAIRIALGGSRGHLFRQLLTESFLLVSAGSVLAWLFALAATRALARWSDIEASLSPDTRVLSFTLAVSILAALVFGFAPLLRAARIPVGEVLKTSGATAFRDLSKARFGRVTAALQVALCLVLLAGTALLVRTLRNLENVNLGFRSTGLLVFGVNPRVEAHADEKTLAFYTALLAKLRSLPEVESATLMGNRIGSGWSNNTSAIVDNKQDSYEHAPMRWNNVGSDYFRTLGIPVIEGREFNDTDGPRSAKVAVVNSTFAKRYFQGRSAIGHTASFTPKQAYTIVGVVPDSKYTGIREKPIPMAWFPYSQVGDLGAMHVELRVHGNPKLLIPRVAQILVGFAPDLAPLQPMTQKQQFETTISGDRLIARLAMFFGILAGALVATGLYGNIAYNVSRRTSELGIRMALGAERGRILRMILWEGLRLCAVGVLIGLPATFAATRLLASLLYGLTPYDPVSITAAAAGIVAVTIIACLVPAGRAASVNPAIALRNE
jgi:predicted permease